MQFNSWPFAGLFLIVIPVFWMLRNHRRPRTFFLLMASYTFYGWWDWRFLGLLVSITAVNYTAALQLDCLASVRGRRLLLASGVALNLAVLGAFKYFDFFVTSTVRVLRLAGFASLQEPTLSIILPLGISFFTFQALGYLIDVYRGDCVAERDPITFGLFVSFFPQLVAGPIERASHLLPQLKTSPRFTASMFAEGCSLIYWGLFKKMFVADNLAPIVAATYGHSSPSAIDTIIGTVAFAFQIYCDFSGYTDIARGTARCLGIDLCINFREPYAASDISRFWQRWHISLSSWFRDYLYIPLGGNRRGTARTLANLFVIMTLVGLWHGAGLNFILWGVYHGTLLAGHRLWRAVRCTIDAHHNHSVGLHVGPAACAAGRLACRGISIGFTFLLVALGWVFFRAENLSHAACLLTSLGRGWTLSSFDTGHLQQMAFVLAPFLAIEIIRTARPNPNVLIAAAWPVRAVVYAVLFYLLVIYGAIGGIEFIYFQF